MLICHWNHNFNESWSQDWWTILAPKVFLNLWAHFLMKSEMKTSSVFIPNLRFGHFFIEKWTISEKSSVRQDKFLLKHSFFFSFNRNYLVLPAKTGVLATFQWKVSQIKIWEHEEERINEKHLFFISLLTLSSLKAVVFVVAFGLERWEER